MKNNGPIILIDDDQDDLANLVEAATELGIGNEIRPFGDARMALAYLRGTAERPFLVLCDINMPLMDGFELREAIQRDGKLALAATPFIYLSTSGSRDSVNRGFGLGIQGHFTKPASFGGIVQMLASIVAYWSISNAPLP